MRGAVTSDGYVLLREDRSARAQNWASRRGAFTFRQEKIKRFASSGISGHNRSGRTQTKLNGRGGMSFGPLRRDRRAVFTSCDSKNYDCLQPPVRKVLAFMLCRLTDVRHAPSEPPVKRTLADGDQRKEPLLTEVDVNACEVRPPPAVHDCHGRRSRQKLVVVDHQLRKASQVFEEKELDKHIAVRICQAGGSGEGEWSRRVALHEACMGDQVHTGTRIHWDAHQTFFCTKRRGRGGVQANSSGIRILKNFENYGRPLNSLPIADQAKKRKRERSPDRKYDDADHRHWLHRDRKFQRWRHYQRNLTESHTSRPMSIDLSCLLPMQPFRARLSSAKSLL